MIFVDFVTRGSRRPSSLEGRARVVIFVVVVDRPSSSASGRHPAVVGDMVMSLAWASTRLVTVKPSSAARRLNCFSSRNRTGSSDPGPKPESQRLDIPEPGPPGRVRVAHYRDLKGRPNAAKN